MLLRNEKNTKKQKLEQYFFLFPNIFSTILITPQSFT